MTRLEWKIAYAPHALCRDREITRAAQLYEAGYEILPAKVPGNFECDLMRAGKLPDLYYSTDTLAAQALENLHLWYFTEFDLPEGEGILRFEGIDTVSDIYLNGILTASTDNMFLAYEVDTNLQKGKNELLVHIKPACIEARKHRLPISSYAMKYGYESLALRKSPHMFGWDIMPRIVSAGLWKEVRLLPPPPKDRIEDVYFVTNRVDTAGGYAELRLFVSTVLDGDFAREYTVKVRGVCGDSVFTVEKQLWHTDDAMSFAIHDCRFWAPRPAGEPNLYDVTVQLCRGDVVCDTKKTTLGVRTVKLLMTECAAADGSGEFCFEINGKKVFLLGTNWVPLDAFPSQAASRLDKALDLLYDIGCNAVRCWGGNAYEADEFYDFCDRKGIVVWQDFAMGSAVYPQETAFAERLETEAVAVIKRLR
ncbi:MAG: glycoside hydrolase family 2 protein, partial [Eubacteriales bacterium]